jgi:hypothetical protein
LQGETSIQNQIRIAIPREFKGSVVMFRNQVGRHETANGWISYGLGPGSSDLVGWATIDGIARFVAIEVKPPGGRLRKDQAHFLATVAAAGGIAGVARSVDEALAILHSAIPTDAS